MSRRGAICEECGAVLTGSRSKRFCGAKCRYRHWDRNNPRIAVSEAYNAQESFPWHRLANYKRRGRVK